MACGCENNKPQVIMSSCGCNVTKPECKNTAVPVLMLRKCGKDFYPETHVDAVINKECVTLGEILDGYNNLLVDVTLDLEIDELTGVPSLIKPDLSECEKENDCEEPKHSCLPDAWKDSDNKRIRLNSSNPNLDGMILSLDRYEENAPIVYEEVVTDEEGVMKLKLNMYGLPMFNLKGLPIYEYVTISEDKATQWRFVYDGIEYVIFDDCTAAKYDLNLRELGVYGVLKEDYKHFRPKSPKELDELEIDQTNGKVTIPLATTMDEETGKPESGLMSVVKLGEDNKYLCLIIDGLHYRLEKAYTSEFSDIIITSQDWNFPVITYRQVETRTYCDGETEDIIITSGADVKFEVLDNGSGFNKDNIPDFDAEKDSYFLIPEEKLVKIIDDGLYTGKHTPSVYNYMDLMNPYINPLDDTENRLPYGPYSIRATVELNGKTAVKDFPFDVKFRYNMGNYDKETSRFS